MCIWPLRERTKGTAEHDCGEGGAGKQVFKLGWNLLSEWP